MGNDPLPASDHVARYCPPSRLSEIEPERPKPEAFLLRKARHEEYLSVDWMEMHSHGSLTQQLAGVRRALSARMDPARNGRLAVLGVGEVLTAVKVGSPDHRSLSITHQPRRPDDSHSGIFGTNGTAAELVVAALLAECVRETHPTAGPGA